MNWTGNILIAITWLTCISTSCIAQPVPKISLWGQKVVPLLLKFDSECVRDGYKIDGSMGVYKIIRYASMRDSLEHWYISLMIDDSYKEQPPREYAQLTDEIFFFYDGNEMGGILGTPATIDVLKYLEELVADRLFIRPPKKQRYSEHRVKGELVREDVQKDISGGYPRNSIWFTFKKNNNITTSRPFRN